MLQRSKKHLSDSKVNYWGHFVFALKASALLMFASITSFVHAFLPVLFPATAARIVIRLYKERLAHHPNPEYQRMLMEPLTSRKTKEGTRKG